MPLWDGFCGGAYTTRSPNIDAEDCINLYPETVEVTRNAKKKVLYGTPGLRRLTTAATLGCRGQFFQDGRAFAVIGATLYELMLSGTGAGLVVVANTIGTVGTDGLPVLFASNGVGGNQIALVSAGLLYIYNTGTNTLSGPVTVPLVNPAGSVLFLNGYFLLAETASLKVWFSELEDGTTWNGLDFFARSNTSDNIVGMVALHDQIKVFGSKTSELFYNAGEADNPFLPYPGSISMDGAVSRYAMAVNGEAIVWVSKNDWDVVRVMMSGAGEAGVISTPALEFILASYSTVSDVEIFIYEQEGHPFVVLTFPTADVTWAYDLREKEWHKRLAWDGNAFHRWRARGTCAPGRQTILAGDYLTGDLYAIDLDTFTENCVPIRRLRRAPYLGAENQWMYLDQVELGLQGGVGRTAVPNPTVTLRVSRDFGNTYSVAVTAPMGAAGAWKDRAIWRHLGRSRADRLVLEVSQTDAVRSVYGPGLYLRAGSGSGLL